MTELSKEDLKKVDKFNSAIKSLCTIVSKLDPNNIGIERTKKQVALFIDTSPLEVRELVRPYFMKYETQIKAKNDKFFLAGVEEFSNASQKVLDIFNIISEKWPVMKEAEKKVIWEKIDIMLATIV